MNELGLLTVAVILHILLISVLLYVLLRQASLLYHINNKNILRTFFNPRGYVEYIRRMDDQLYATLHLINSMDDIVWSVNSNLEIQSFNDAFRDAYGFWFDKEAATGVDFFDSIPEEWVKEEKGIYYTVLRTGQGYEKISDNSKFDFYRSRCVNLYDTRAMEKTKHTYFPIRVGNRVIGVASRITDISYSDRVERALMMTKDRLNERGTALEEIASSTSHQLKSPLTRLQGLVDILLSLLEEEVIDRSEIKNEIIPGIQDSVELMHETISDFLRYSTVRSEIKSNVTNCRLMVNKAIKYLGDRLDNVDIKNECDPISFVGDEGLMVHVFVNLLNNAVKFNNKKLKTVRVTCKLVENGSKIEFHVIDNGMGIPKKYHSDVFKLFTRYNSGIAGTGLGTAMCKRIISMHGGTIWVDSEVGEYSDFGFIVERESCNENTSC